MSQSNYTTIKGVLVDSSGVIQYSAVMLLKPSDTTLITYTITNEKGEFSFDNVKNVSYIFKATHINHLPLQISIAPSSENNMNDLGLIKMKLITRELMEVVIKAAKAPLFFRGDTVEYDVSTFKIPIGASVEDMLRKLPGIEVDFDGNIKSQGKEINKVYVDGKKFFSDNPKTATKNLDAEIVSKVQVFDEKSEQEKLTGVEDGNKNKAMNLELKDDYKKGYFGKVSVAGGTDKRLASRGNYNRFSDKHQLSFIGYANNINKTGVNWEDYTSFLGSNTFRKKKNDGDFGFNSYGNSITIENNKLVKNNNNKGLSENFCNGINYNFNDNKINFSSNYIYYKTKLNYYQSSLRTTFIENETINSENSLNQSDSDATHSFNSSFEIEIDSNNKLLTKASLNYTLINEKQLKDQLFYNSTNALSSLINTDNKNKSNIINIDSEAIYRRKFKKNGRSIAISGGYNQKTNNSVDKNLSLTTIVQVNEPEKQIKHLTDNNGKIKQFKSSALFTEPLSKSFYTQIFYNFTNTIAEIDNQVSLYDNELIGPRIDSLSLFYENNTLFNRLGAILRYSTNKINASLGIAAQQIALDGKYALDNKSNWLDTIDKSYQNLVPYFNFNYKITKFTKLSFGYSNKIKQPSFKNLQPVHNMKNPAYVYIGNPNLKPEKKHNVHASYKFWNRSSFSTIRLSIKCYITYDPIVYNQSISFNDSTGYVSVIQPENMDKRSGINNLLYISIPVVKTKLSFKGSVSYRFNSVPNYINSVRNIADSKTSRFSFGLKYSLNDNLIVDLNSVLNSTDVKYSINNENNQKIFSSLISTDIKWQFLNKTFFESSFDYNNYKNERFNYNYFTQIWNTSIYRLIGKKNKFALRLSAFDLLNKNETISQITAQNYILNSTTNTLTRYFLISLTYKMKGFNDKLNKKEDIF